MSEDSNTIELQTFSYNPTPLMIAAEHGDSNAVDLCIKSGCNINEKISEKRAVDLAWDNRHFEIVLDLLKANSKYPINFEIELATQEISKFVGVTKDLYNLILKEDIVNIGKILDENPNLRHFYSVEGNSAPAYALINEKFRAYEFLIANNVYIDPNENVDEIFTSLSQNKCEDIKKIHLKYLKNFKDNHLIILAMNSVLYRDDFNAAEKLTHVRDAYKFLDQFDPFISSILQIVAASRDFKIIFDFDSSTNSASDVKIDTKLDTIRDIKIPAADLLNPDKILNVYQILIRELCIYALELVYKKNGCPYNDFIKECEVNRNSEELVDNALNSSTNNSELITLVPQLMVKYSNDPVKMDTCRVKFPELFKFCQEVVQLEMNRKLPTIKSSAEQKALKFKILNQKQRKLLVALILTIPIAIWLTFLINKPFIEPIYSCKNLTDELRSKIFDSTVDFQGVNVIFGDLFGKNSSACEHLSPQEVTKMVKDGRISKSIENRSDFEDVLKINSENIHKEEMNQYKDESSYEEPSLKIGKKVDIHSRFYTERRIHELKNYNRELGFSGASYITEFNEASNLKLLLLSDKGGSGKSTFFCHMAWKLKRRFPLKWISYIDLKQHIPVLKDVPQIDANLTTFVDFISSKILNLTSKVEIDVFRRKFLSNDSILLWDGVDEVSPVYKDEVLRVVEVVWRLTGNKQWVATRPHLEEQIYNKFNSKPHVLEEFDIKDKQNFIEKFLDANGIKNQNLSKVFTEIDDFLIKLNTRMITEYLYPELNTNPIMLYIVCDAYAKNMQLTEKTNFYTLYDSYFIKNFEDVVMNKGDIVQKDIFKVTELGMFRTYHQQLALFIEIYTQFQSIFTGISLGFNTKTDVYKSLQKLQEVEVMRFGIVYKYSGTLLFEQTIFREFFIAQYFFANLWTNPLPFNSRDEDADISLNFLFSVLHRCQTKYKIVCDFIIGFVEAYSDTQTDSSFNPIIKNLLLNNYSDLMDYVGDNAHVIDVTTKFFKKDRDVINVYWKIDQNRTFFHKYFEKVTIPADVEIMTKITRENFNASDAEKIIFGKYQAANFLRLTWQKRRIRNHTVPFVEVLNFKCDIEALTKIPTFEKFMEYLETQNYSREELLEFFKIIPATRAVRIPKDMEIVFQYAEKMLSVQDFADIKEIWHKVYPINLKKCNNLCNYSYIALA